MVELKRDRFPPGVDYLIPYDTTIFVSASIKEVLATFVEAARLFAARLVATGGQDDHARLRTAFRTALARDPKPAELKALTAFLATQRTTYRAAPAEADKLLRIGLAPPITGDVAELATWTQLARVLLNTQEVITRY